LEADLREELIIAVTPESFMPEMPSQRLSKSMAFAEFIANAQMDPNSELAAYVGDQFGIPKSIVGLDATKARAYEMIDRFREQAKTVSEQFGDAPTFDVEDPMVAQIAQVIVDAAQMPVSGLMDNTVSMIDVLRDWWLTDEGRTSSNLLKAAIVLRGRELQMAQVKELQTDQMHAMMVQQPMQEMQAAAGAEAQNAQEEGAIAEGMKELAIEDARLDAENKRLELEQTRLSQDAEERRAQREHEYAMMQAQVQAKQNQSAKSSD